MEPNRDIQNDRHTLPVVTAPANTPFDNLPADALLTAAQIKPLYGNPSDMTLWRWLRDGKFPQPHKHRNGRRLWRWGTIRDDLKAA